MTLTVYNELEQGTPEWHDARRGIVTASVLGQLITPGTVKPSSNDYSRSTTLHLVAERITGHTEDTFLSADMARGHFDEPYAREVYSEHYADVTEVGFMVRDDWGFKIGFSPDGLVGEDGAIEIKSRKQKAQLSVILHDEVPMSNMAQLQGGLLVSGRSWIDYVSYCGGMPLYTKRVLPDPKWATAILDAVRAFEDTAAKMTAAYELATIDRPATERIEQYEEMRL